ncbi:hypothetical protein ACLOAU_19275 [Niabella sp. CJ426]|uniref:hypothetical protein n=1 Tax=Niabella sp. CJ426 TaxID=3393740 RepID=UPI003D08E43E
MKFTKTIVAIFNNVLLGITEQNNRESTIESEKLLQHKEFLKSIFEEERSRLENLESKTSQLISQTSIIISLASIFIPLLIDKSSELVIYLKIFLLSLLISTYLCYTLTIVYALKNYNLKKFKYSSPDPINVTNFRNKSVDDFNRELIKDYSYSIGRNQEINNTKATNVIKSYSCFRLANIFLSVLVIIVCVSTIFKGEDYYKVQLMHPIEAEIMKPVKLEYDTLFKRVHAAQKDSIKRKDK